MAETNAVPPRGLVWQAVDAVKSMTITPESELAAPKPMTVRDVVRENKRLLDQARFELECERQQCLLEIKRAEREGKKHLSDNKRRLAALCAQRAQASEQQIERIERAKNTIQQNGQTVNEFSTMTTITQVMASIARTMELVQQGPASGAQLKLITAQLRRQSQLAEAQRNTVDAAVAADDIGVGGDSAESILSGWEQSMVLNAPRPPGSGGGGGDAPPRYDRLPIVDNHGV